MNHFNDVMEHYGLSGIVDEQFVPPSQKKKVTDFDLDTLLSKAETELGMKSVQFAGVRSLESEANKLIPNEGTPSEEDSND